MKKHRKIWAFIMSVVLFYSCTADPTTMLKNTKVFYANKVDENGVIILDNYSSIPKKGVLDTFSIELPEYESVLYFSTDQREKFLDAANRVFPWVANDLRTIVSDGFNPDPKAKEPSRNGLLALFKVKTNNYLLIQGIASPEALSHLVITDEGKLLIKLVTFGTDTISGNIPLVAYAKGDNIYKVFQQAWKSAINTQALAGRTAMRYEKEYPDMFNYLGWCSWEQYRRNITSDLIVDAIKKIETGSLPVRWVLVDDGHQHQTGTGMGDSRILSFEANPETFPDGFHPIKNLKSEKIKWMGIWHAMNGQWQGLHPDHEIPELDGHLINIAKKYKGNPMDVMMPKGDSTSSQLFYKTLIGKTKEQGFDFIKIDNQNRQLAFYQGQPNPVKIVSQHAQSLEKAAHDLSGGLINCFCADLLSLMNTKYSAVSRISVDYLLNNEEKAKSHLFQSYQNTLWMGQAVWPDHDMFHSSDKFCGRMMAVSKALSGAPIYLSDAPDDFMDKLVTPLCFSNGKLLRPLAPAVPLPESVMLSALTTAKAYRVMAPLPHGAAAIAVYNLAHPTPSESVFTKITAEDYTHAGSFMQPTVETWELPEEGLVYYDWYIGKGGLLEDGYEIELTGFSDAFVQLTPIINGWSVIGCSDKYLSAAAIDDIIYNVGTIEVKLRETGSLVIYHDSEISCPKADNIVNLGCGLWKLEFKDEEPAMHVVVSAI